jgi:hypothetical protein
LIDRDSTEKTLNNTTGSIKDLELNKKIIEEELKKNQNNFTFKTYNYPLIEVYGSAVFSSVNYTFNLNQEPENFKNIYINIIPEKTELKIIVGYGNHASNKWTQNYVDSWKNLNKIELEKNLTELFSARIETWGLSEKLFNKILKNNIRKFINHWREEGSNFSYSQKVNFNLFETS